MAEKPDLSKYITQSEVNVYYENYCDGLIDMINSMDERDRKDGHALIQVHQQVRLRSMKQTFNRLPNVVIEITSDHNYHYSKNVLKQPS